MEDIAFSDWPGQPIHLSGSNPWLPAYGFQQPHSLLDKDDFLGNPDAEFFFHGGSSNYVYLETIQEETSDDLCSDSDVSETRASPAGWLATDSESGSVIRIQVIEDEDSQSDREVACPAKRRRQDYLISDDDLSQSLSRSSSLVQFENFEKQCETVFSSSPSIFSSYSYDSLERRGNLSPDSLERIQSDEGESEYYKILKIDVPVKKRARGGSCSNHSDSDSGDSEETLGASRYGSSKSVNLKTWRSFDGLYANSNVVKTVKVSAENLSEDSGYGDFCSIKGRSSSIPNMIVVQHEKIFPEKDRNVYKTRVQIGGNDSFAMRSGGFDAYDGDVVDCYQSFSNNFGVSYHDLSIVDKYEHRSPLIDRFMRNGAAKKRLGLSRADAVNIEKTVECVTSKYNSSSASEPNLLSNSGEEQESGIDDLHQSNYLEESVCVSSVPNDLNLAGDLKCEDSWSKSVANQDLNLADLQGCDCDCDSSMPKLSRYHRAEYGDKIRISLKYDSSSISSASDVEGGNTSFKREGSYMEAMTNAIDMSDEENQRKVNKGGFQVLNAISETSLASFGNSLEKLSGVIASTPIYKEARNVKSTPNLVELSSNKETNLRSMLVNRSTSTSGVSDADDKTEKVLMVSSKSFSGSTGSKGVHFSPVVAEVNWRDDSESTESVERESSYSLSSTPEREFQPIKSERISASQPELLQKVKEVAPSKKKPATIKEEFITNSNSIAKLNNDLHLVSVYQSPTPKSHVSSNINVVKAMNMNNPVPAMEPVVTHRDSKIKSSGKLGGFFSRLASFRFSNRNEKNKQKKKYAEDAPQNNKLAPQKLATKDDYIYIPLKDPQSKSCNNNKNENCVSGKPPLPKLPPRVVSACVKKRPEVNAQSVGVERRTIDSGLPRPMEPMGLIETDLDTEVTVITSGAHVKTRSLMNLGAEAPTPCLAAPAQNHPGRPHKSMEFLLDKQNLKVVEPPENELQKVGERVMSEHQLRVQRSLQKLNVPDWYKHAQVPREGFLLKKSSTPRECRWQGTGSKTTSLSSLGSNSHSPVILSPTLHSQPFVRWSTSKLNSTASSPCASTRSSFNARQPNGSISPSSLRSSFSYRQPYLGWRSQERLSRPRTPAERLANTIITQTPAKQQECQEIRTSIKEVTSAIVHYVSGLRPENNMEHSYDSQETASQRSRSVSPRSSQKLCWLESSFVGTRPLDSPQTPVSLTENSAPISVPATNLRLDLQTHNDLGLLNTGGSKKPSPSSTTLEDVLDSLLGLPSSTRAPSPSLQETASANTSPVHCPGEHSRMSEQFRRRSEGSEPSSRPSSGGRGSSFQSPILRCRYSKCGKSATVNSPEALNYKNCHNCSYTYCSRTCRRSHWEKHRKTCLFSRVGTLCRQVIAAAKQQEDTLYTLSVIARRGYLSHSLGAVKLFFPCPEAAEKFLLNGLGSLGEPTYVRWANLLPSEMGPQLYEELVKMCKSYNPDTKLVLYVSVCVVSEAPAAGAVKWERQLVSRCGKLKLSKHIYIPEKDIDAPETLILTSSPIKQQPMQRIREICCKNIQHHLHQRGVSIKRQYPQVYQQLQQYVDATVNSFVPVTIYPKDSNTGKTFMCIIMPDAEPESVKKVTTAGVRVRTVNVLKDDPNLDYL